MARLPGGASCRARTLRDLDLVCPHRARDPKRARDGPRVEAPREPAFCFCGPARSCCPGLQQLLPRRRGCWGSVFGLAVRLNSSCRVESPQGEAAPHGAYRRPCGGLSPRCGLRDLFLCTTLESADCPRSSTDRISPSEGGDRGSIPLEGTRIKRPRWLSRMGDQGTSNWTFKAVLKCFYE